MNAGLVAGFHGNQSGKSVIGINVSRGKAEREEKVFQLVRETLTHIGIQNSIPREDF